MYGQNLLVHKELYIGRKHTMNQISFFATIAFALTKKRNITRKTIDLFSQVYNKEYIENFEGLSFNSDEFNRLSSCYNINLTIFGLRKNNKKVLFHSKNNGR